MDQTNGACQQATQIAIQLAANKSKFVKVISIILICWAAEQIILSLAYYVSGNDYPTMLNQIYQSFVASPMPTELSYKYCMAVGYLSIFQSVILIFMGILGIRQRKPSVAINLGILVLAFAYIAYLFIPMKEIVWGFIGPIYDGATPFKRILLKGVYYLIMVSFVPTVELPVVVPFMVGASALHKKQLKCKHS